MKIRPKRASFGVDDFGISYRREKPLRGARVHHRIVAASLEKLGQRHLRFAVLLVRVPEA